MLDKNNMYEGDIVLSSKDGNLYMVGESIGNKASLTQVSEERMPDGSKEYYPTGKTAEVPKDELNSRNFLMMETARPEKGNIIKLDVPGESGYFKVTDIKDGEVKLQGVDKASAGGRTMFVDNNKALNMDYETFRRAAEPVVSFEKKENIFERAAKKIREGAIRINNALKKGRDKVRGPVSGVQIDDGKITVMRKSGPKPGESAAKLPPEGRGANGHHREATIKLPAQGKEGAGKEVKDIAVKRPMVTDVGKAIASAKAKAAASQTLGESLQMDNDRGNR